VALSITTGKPAVTGPIAALVVFAAFAILTPAKAAADDGRARQMDSLLTRDCRAASDQTDCQTRQNILFELTRHSENSLTSRVTACATRFSADPEARRHGVTLDTARHVCADTARTFHIQ